MKICWDNLKDIYYNKEIGLELEIDKDIYTKQIFV